MPLTLYNKYKGLCEPLLLEVQVRRLHQRRSSARRRSAATPAHAARSLGQHPHQPRRQQGHDHGVRRRADTAQPAHRGHGRRLRADAARRRTRRSHGETFNVGYQNHSIAEHRARSCEEGGRGGVPREGRRSTSSPRRRTTTAPITSIPTRSPRARLRAEAHASRTRCATSCRAFRDHLLPEQLRRRLVLQRADDEEDWGAMSREADRRRHRRRRLHRQPHGRSAARPRLRRARHRQPGRRARGQSRASRQRSGRSRCDIATSASFSPAMPCSTACDYVFHFAGIGDIVPSIERPLDYMSTNVQGTVARARMRACRHGGRRRRSSSMPPRRPATGWPTTPTREDHPIAPQYPYALSKYQGEQAVLSLGAGLQAAGELDPHLQRLRHALAHVGRLRRRLRRVPARRSSRASRSPSSATARRRATSSSSPTWPRAFLAAAETEPARRDLQSRRRQSAVGQPAGRAARRRRSCISRSARASPTAPGPTSPRSRASSAGRRA